MLAAPGDDALEGVSKIGKMVGLTGRMSVQFLAAYCCQGNSPNVQ